MSDADLPGVPHGGPPGGPQRGSPVLLLLAAAQFLTDLDRATQSAIVAENASARLLGLRTALWLVALLTVLSLFFTGMLPREAVGVQERTAPAGTR